MEADPSGGHRARKRFSQNFLHDAHYIGRIVDAIAPRPGDRLLEIGPGLAALTEPLLERAGELTCVEIDRDLAARLRTRFADAKFTLIEADALALDWRHWRRPIRARCASSATCRTTSPRRCCSRCCRSPTACATSTSCCRRKWSTAWRRHPAATTTAACR
jgi:hypothetical protein